MKKRFYLPGLNPELKQIVKKKGNIEGFLSLINKSTCPLIHKFISDKEINKFYQENFKELDVVKLREKRLLDFETPNRARIVHELDIDTTLSGSFRYNQFYYLFNPFNRLSWLKITQDNKRLTVANEKQVKTLVKKVLNKEITSLIIDNHITISCDDVFEDLWQRKKGYPCFVKIENIHRPNFILKSEYFDSIKSDPSKKNPSASLFCPIEERSIKYAYFPLEKRSSWLYLKAPKNFNISANIINLDERINFIDKYSSGKNNSDPDISSMTIVNLGHKPEKDVNVYFDINITVPESLKIWYLTIYYLSLVVLLMLFFRLINSMYLYLDFPVLVRFNPLEKILTHGNFNNIIVTLIAGIIATRGWLISEETILKKYSKNLTIIMILLLLLPALNCLFSILTG